MKRVSLGRTGEMVSAIGLGFWQAGSPLWGTKGRMGSREAASLLEAAIGAGITLVDTAEVYGWGESERLLGEALVRLHRRGDLLVATKVAGFRWGEGSIVKAVRASRARLGVESIDLVQHHWPPPAYAGVCRVARGLERLVDEGIARYVGVSNYSTGDLERLVECMKRHEPVSNQIQYSLAYRKPENRLLPLHRRLGVTTIAWSPLAKGALAHGGDPREALSRATRAQKSDPVFRRALRDEVLQGALGRVAEREGLTRAQVALAWLVARGALPIPGTRRRERVLEYARAGEVELSPGSLRELDEASRGYVGGGDYDALGAMRIVPAFLQAIVIRLMGGV